MKFSRVRWNLYRDKSKHIWYLSIIEMDNFPVNVALKADGLVVVTLFPVQTTWMGGKFAHPFCISF